jgi:hypothetical protein
MPSSQSRVEIEELVINFFDKKFLGGYNGFGLMGESTNEETL